MVSRAGSLGGVDIRSDDEVAPLEENLPSLSNFWMRWFQGVGHIDVARPVYRDASRAGGGGIAWSPTKGINWPSPLPLLHETR
jgi:hypothetical protein